MRRSGARLFVALVALAVGLLVGCSVPRGGWDLSAFGREHPDIALPRGHRLGDLAPHFWFDDDELLQFACRWPLTRPIPVALKSADGPEREERLLRRALVALSDGIPSLTFRRVAAGSGERAIRVEFEDRVDPDPASGNRAGADSGDAIADCRVDAPLAAGAAGDRLPARIESASVRILRAQLDWRGQEVVLDDLALLAVLLHELGHALGFSSHTASGDTLMRAAPGEARLRARAVLRGEPVRDATLAALYAVPNGVVLRRDPAPRDGAVTARLFAALAKSEGLERPWSRAGQGSAEVWWTGPARDRWALRASRGVAGWPSGFVLRANAAALRALRASRSDPVP